MTTKTRNLSLKPAIKDNLPSSDDTPPSNGPVSAPVFEFWAGIKTITPLLLGVLPFALIVGIFAVDMGLHPILATGMSVIILAGTSQLVMLQLITENTPIVVILLTVIVINLRFSMYSASMSLYFKDLSLKWRTFLAYLLTDQAYAVSIIRFSKDPQRPDKHWFYFGAGLAMCLLWVFGTLAGALLGAQIPANWSLDFAIPLMFIAVVVPAIKGRPAITAALTAGVVVILAANIPFNLDLIVAAFAGIIVGVVIEEWYKKKDLR